VCKDNHRANRHQYQHQRQQPPFLLLPQKCNKLFQQLPHRLWRYIASSLAKDQTRSLAAQHRLIEFVLALMPSVAKFYPRPLFRMSRSSKNIPPRRSNLLPALKVIIAIVLASVLFVLGQRGRDQAQLQGHVHQVNTTRAQLQTVLDSYVPSTSKLLSSGGETNLQQLLTNPQFQNLLSVIKAGVQQVEAQSRELDPQQALDLRLARAALANAELRFTDALATLPESDISLAESFGEPHREKFISVLRLRADAFYGLQRWAEAFPLYSRILELRPGQVETATRQADCFRAQGQHGEALVAYTELARVHLSRGDALMLADKIEPALEHYQNAVSIYSRIIQQDPRSALALEWARAVDRFSAGLVLQGNAIAAVGNFDKSIELRNRLLASEGRRPEVLAELGASLFQRGNAFLVQRRVESATNDYVAAENVWTELADRVDPLYREDLSDSYEQHANALVIVQNPAEALRFYNDALEQRSKSNSTGSAALTNFPVVLNNRAVVLRIQNDIATAISDFSKAAEVLRADFEQSASKPVALSTNVSPEFMLEIVISMAERETEFIARTRFTLAPSRADIAVALATTLRNRGYAYLANREAPKALDDLAKAIAVYERVVDREGQADLALQYAKSLAALAWLQATHPEASLRNPLKANELALKACVLTEWKAHFALDALAAAAGEKGDFTNAVKWQQQAIGLAPARLRAELQSRLDLYVAGKPFRSATLN
jgi:tetratricopeptide (TPR) repeat protein